jgi:hypothetical protein
VEVYSQQLLTGEESVDEEYSEGVTFMLWYAERCSASQWKAEFAPHLNRAYHLTRNYLNAGLLTWKTAKERDGISFTDEQLEAIKP